MIVIVIVILAVMVLTTAAVALPSSPSEHRRHPLVTIVYAVTTSMPVLVNPASAVVTVRLRRRGRRGHCVWIFNDMTPPSEGL